VERPRRVVRFARSIHAARPRLWAGLRPAPPSATVWSCPGCHPGWTAWLRPRHLLV